MYFLLDRNINLVKSYRGYGATVARSTPDRKVAGSNPAILI